VLGDMSGEVIEVKPRYNRETMIQGARRLMEVMSGQALSDGIDLEEIERRQRRRMVVDLRPDSGISDAESVWSEEFSNKDLANTGSASSGLHDAPEEPVDYWEVRAISSYYTNDY
jgi:hypothetical protein